MSEAGTNTVSVQLPHNGDSANPEIKYFTYTYTKPANYTTATGRVTKLSTANVKNVLFQGLPTASGGGAINNKADNSSVDIISDFVDNYGSSTAYISSGAIENYAYVSRVTKIGNITGVFIGNYVKSEKGYAQGGAIYNVGDPSYTAEIGNITGDFIGNYAQTTSYASGGVLHNESLYGEWEYGVAKIGDITGNFIGNYATGSSTAGGVILNEAYSGDTITLAELGNITGNFIGNYAQGSSSAYGGVIYNHGTIGDITGDFIGNYAQGSRSAYGGVIYNSGTIGSKDTDGNVVGGIINSSFIGNCAKSETGTAQGGAIWTKSDLNIIAQDGYTSIISGNYVEDVDGKRPEAIRLTNKTTSTYVGYYAINGTTTTKSINKDNISSHPLSLINNTNSKTVIDDQIVGEATEFIDGMYHTVYNYDTNKHDKYYVDENYYDIETPEATFVNSKLNITGDGTGLVQLNNDVVNFDITLDNSTLHLGARDNVLNNNNLTLNSGTLSMINNQVGVSSLSSLHLYGTTDFLADVDLASGTMDRFKTDVYGLEPDAKLNVVGMNLLSDATQDTTRILFAENSLKDNVTTTVTEVAYSPIYKYNVSYDKSGHEGYFVFNRATTSSGSSGGTGSAEVFNPAVLGSSTSATVGALGTMNNTMAYAFQNADNYMHIPYLERIAIRDRNKYALSPTGDATDMGTYSPLFTKNEYGSAWVKPYATFESVDLKNGPKVSNITYGTLIGFDTDLESIKGGWDRTFTGYIGYNGASQRYSGVDTYQNGGLIGGTMTLYKGNFFNATTLSVGASVANNTTMYGNDNYTMLLGGIGNKTGYNFEFKEGKVILQPSMLLSYTFVNTFDYTNAAGVRIDNDPLHAIQLAPGMKLIGNLKNGWQPYVGVSMVWNLMGESDTTANGVKLPEMSIKPYVQYGVGLQKRFKDHFMGFGQAMIQNGGRNGISLTAGFRWALGHDNCKYKDQKVEAKQLRVKAAKQLRSEGAKQLSRHSELDSESINANNQTLTPPLSLGEGAKKEILRSAQNDNKIQRHPEGGEQRMKAKAYPFNASRTEGSLTNSVKDSSHVSHIQNDDNNCHRGQVPRSQEIAQQVRNGNKNNEILRSAQNDRPERKILKQMTPEQKVAYGKAINTSRSAKAGMLRQL